jgi:hypothetical protein
MQQRDGNTEKLKQIASKKVIAVAERASEKAVFRNDMHNFWSAVFHSYLKIEERFQAISYLFPGVRKVIHSSEIMPGDILVSDFHSGMNFGFLEGGITPVKIRVLGNNGDLITGMVVGVGIGDITSMRYVGKTGNFKNEIWYFVSHKFIVIDGFNRCR